MNIQNLSMERSWAVKSSKSDFHAEARFRRRNAPTDGRAPGKYCQSKSAHQGLRYSTLNMGIFALRRAITRGNVPGAPSKNFSGFQGVRGFF